MQTQRHAMTPALTRDAFRSHELHAWKRRDANSSSVGDDRQKAIGMHDCYLFPQFAAELSQRSERADAPLRFAIRELSTQEFNQFLFRRKFHVANP